MQHLQIGFDYCRILHDFFWKTFGDFFSVVKDHNTIGKTHYRLHQMFDKADSNPAVPNPADKINHFLDLNRVKTGHYLVKKK